MTRNAILTPLLCSPWLALAPLHAAPEPTGATDLEGGRVPSVSLPADLARVLNDYEVAWRERDEEALAALFTGDGFVLPNGRPPVRGREAIRRHYADSGGPLVLRAMAFDTEGSVGYIIGAFARAESDPDLGKFTLTLRRQADGRWLIVSDMDSPNRGRSSGD